MNKWNQTHFLGHEKATDLLTAHGANIDAQNNAGSKAIDIAAENGN